MTIKRILILIISLILATTLVFTFSPIVFIINAIRYTKLGFNSTLDQYLYNILVSLDQFAGTILYNQLDFTISSYTFYLCYYRNNKAACIFKIFIDVLFGNDHCKNSFQSELKDYEDFLKRIKK